MPDQGRQEHGQAGEHAGWANALNALPLETPAADGWQRLQARLPAQAAQPRRRFPLWLATAASLSIAAAIPVWMLSRPHVIPASATVGATASPAPIAAPASALESGAAAAETKPIDTPAASATSTTKARTVAARPPRASTATPTIAAAPATPSRNVTPAPAIDDALAELHARSARLEQLLAMARDEGIAYGSNAALSDALDDRIASIDAALIQGGIDANERAALWDARVDTLQQLVGIEATQRLNAAHGQSYQASLVTID